ncbi:MAG: hypothetical protein ING01_17925 [Rhodobacter sp.]|nr:hypothetical protein [Rhodobacter sp.]
MQNGRPASRDGDRRCRWTWRLARAALIWFVISPLTATRHHNPTLRETEILDLIKAAPVINRHFHASDLRRVIGSAAYAARVLGISAQHGCSTFTATLVVHGQAVLEGEITH